MSDDAGNSGRTGAKQPQRFDPARAAMLDDPSRFNYLPPSEVLALLDPPEHGAAVVDYGAGTGMYAIAIAQLRPDFRVIAFDEQPEMVNLLRERIDTVDVPNVFPTGRDSFGSLHGVADRIMAVNVLHEMGDDALDEMRDLLKDDGPILFADWSGDVDRPVGPPRDHVYSLGEAKTRLEEHRYRIVREHRFPYHYAVVVRPS
jgi:SAM-dependent methyltransferase